MPSTLETTYNRLHPLLDHESTESLGTISQRDLERFAVAANSPLPPNAAPQAPPLFLSSVMGWGAGPAEEELGRDGTSGVETRGLPVGEVQLMGAGQDLEFHAPVTAGSAVVVRTCLVQVELKHGRSGQLLILRLRRRFTDDQGHPLVTCHESFIAR